ncbi:DUF2213 domain-containing protein [Achromobacter marplatensis]|uniref:DUF2213 domain-containing protein n=1 Tax=Achromobacter marplatensis TaxID=470868 RepID=A0AA43AYK0_9BURK|nr:DUF2213 domain-containing protein [Achromobacter marplatensis]MDH2051171.1 DUF2213 domain-containing protein [Achromobacter marplatensis]
MNKNNPDGLAFDRASVRTVDQDGRLRVEITHISKAAVNPYRGDEIPDWERLGLDPNRVYFLLRAPDELARAAPSFNNIPLLSKHVPVTVDEPQKEFVVGATGSDAVFTAPYLDNSLVVWDAVAIAGIESRQQQELSSAYRYRADMTAGVYQGVPYDGVMRDIRGNHVALVEVGRAGPDVVVGDSNTLKPSENPKMKFSKTAIAVAAGLRVYLRPKLAQDAALGDLGPLVKGLTAKNFASERPRLVRAVEGRFKGKLAQDADLADLVEVIDAFSDPADPVVAGDEEDPETPPVAEDDDLMAKMRDMISAKLGAEEAERIMQAIGEPSGAEDSPPAFAGKPDEPVSKPAMDAALAKATKEGENAAVARMTAIRTAEQECRPIIGDIIAQDSAEAVYKMALDAKGIDLTDTPPSAYRALVKLALTQEQTPKTPRLAQDSAAHKGFSDRYPTASHVKVL